MSTVMSKVRINGSPMRADVQERVSQGSLRLGARSVSSFDFTIVDTPDLYLTTNIPRFLGPGATIIWEEYVLGLSELSTGGGTNVPTIEVSAISDYVMSLKRERGGKDWGTTDVSAWAKVRIEEKGATPLVQPGLGERELERKEPEGDGQKGESTWDTMVDAAKQVGAWVFEYGNIIVFARPSWLAKQKNLRRFEIYWNSWTDHTDALTSAPEYSWNEDADAWEGKEQLVIRAVDPDDGSGSILSQARPGDLLRLMGNASPSNDVLWMITQVQHPVIPGRPVTITCWRPIDPPEIVKKSDKTEGTTGSSSAGVPTGPIGQFGWIGEQLKMATEIVKEGQRRKLPELALQLSVCCAMGESSLINVPYGDGAGPDSCGLFQQRDPWGPREVRMQPSGAAGLFMDKLLTIDYRGKYDNGATSLPASNIGVVYLGPGKSANAASVTIHHVQINADPYHYAKYWADAQKVVSACIQAGKDASSGGALPGPLDAKVEKSVAGMVGKWIEFDGGFPNQCVDVAKQYIADLTGMRNVMGNGVDFWMHPQLSQHFDAISADKPPRKGDLVSWSGNKDLSEYPNGGVGHVAVYIKTENGTDFYLTQNPSITSILPLKRRGVLGWMRPRG